MKKIVSIVLSSVIVFGILSGCTPKEPEVTPTPEPTESEKVYVYGIAGDMFREFVNLVSQEKMEEVMEYIGFDNDAIVTQNDVKRYLMSQKIGNLIAMGYKTINITVEEEGDIRNVNFFYQLSNSTESDSLSMKVKLVGTEWKVNLDAMTTRNAKLRLPQGNYKEIDIDGHKIDVSKFEIDEEGYQVYNLPQIAEYEHPVKIVNSNDAVYDGEIIWEYITSKNGKVTDDAVRTINSEDFIVPQIETTPEPEESQAIIDENNEDSQSNQDIPQNTAPIDNNNGDVSEPDENQDAEVIIPPEANT